MCLSYHELNIRECCISCRAIKTSPRGQVVAGPNSASSVQFQNPDLVCPVSALECVVKRPVVADSVLREAVSRSMMLLKGCRSIWEDAYGPIMFIRTAVERSDRACRNRYKWTERSDYQSEQWVTQWFEQ